MPRRVKFAKKGRRRVRRNRRFLRRKRPYVNTVARGLGFINPRMVTRLKYSDYVNVTMSTGTVSTYVFRLNSVFDPDKTGTGHQPYGFDQLSSLYARYRVFATRWVISLPPPNDTLFFTVVPINSSTTFTSQTLAAENPRAVTKAISSGMTTQYFKGKVYLPRLGGDKRVEFKTDDRFQSVVTTNPAEIQDLHCVMYNDAAGTETVRFFVTLIYYVEFYDPFTVAQS